jgi:CYTH domain-containing protein
MTTPPVEIERTWLLRDVPAIPSGGQAFRLEQGYLPDEAAGDAGDIREGRVRRITAPDGTVECRHTIKHGLGIRRTEIERPITNEEFERHWPRTAGARLTKTRHKVPERMGDLEVVWEVDVFDGLDLVLAEVELPSESAPVTLPAWLAPHVEREVTEEPEYRNFAIARRAVLNAREGRLH